MKYLLALLLVLPLCAESFDDFLKDDSSSFNQEKASFDKDLKVLNKAFQSYQNIINEEFNAYKKSLGRFWSEPKISTKKQWVEHSADLQKRKIVDFENNTITIEVHAKDLSQARKSIAKELIDTVTKDTKDAFNDDHLTQRVEKRLKNAKKAAIVRNPILAPSIFTSPPSIKESISYAKKKIQQNPIRKVDSKIPNLNRYAFKVRMPKNSVIKRSRLYIDVAKREAKRFEIPVALVMAVIQTESGFNPMARSHIPAYGLMQIVPRSAGMDVYRHLYGKRKILSPSFLYNANNNIKFGTAYLSILYYKYLKKVKDPQSRLYCAIAGYNTGAGNVARAFTGRTNPNKAAPYINRKSPKEVYTHLIRNLKYHEARRYLKTITSRIGVYQKLYGRS